MPPPSSSPESTQSAGRGETIEPDHDLNTDDGYASDDGSSTASTSLQSSVRDYNFENNRRYHKFKEGQYLLPNDEPEQEREDMKHAMILHASDGKLHFAPLQDPQRILDIGTGTGIWAIDMGDEYPGAEVMGVDLSPIQTTWVPPNVKFYVDDIESEWVDKPDTLDYVHSRHMAPAIKNWPGLLQQAYRSLVPGGWVELQELLLPPKCDDDTMPEDYGFGQFIKNLAAGLSTFGVDLTGMEKHQELLKDAGFVNVEERVFKVPIGIWPKDPQLKTIGNYNRCVIWEALQGVSMGPYTRGLKWAPEEVEAFLVTVRKSLSDPSIHSYMTYHVVFGQKPTNS